MPEPAKIWRTLHRLKTRRCERLQEQLSQCRATAEQCDHHLADCMQQADACAAHLAESDNALSEMAAKGEPIGVEAILQHQGFRVVLEERCHRADQARAGAQQALQSARDQIADVQASIAKQQAQADTYAQKAASAQRICMEQRDAAEEENAIESLLAQRLHQARRGAGR